MNRAEAADASERAVNRGRQGDDPPELIDAHCHLDSNRLDAPPDELLEDARAHGVRQVVMAGVDADGWRVQRQLALRFPGVAWPVYGVHPQHVATLDGPTLGAELDALAALLAVEPPVALGETGLDRLSVTTREALPLQHEAFHAQLALAAEHRLPLVLHLLRADDASLAVLKAARPEHGGIVHSFSGAWPFAKALLDLGLDISFAGTLTLPQSRRLHDVARRVPADRLHVETDAPDQTPHQARAPLGPATNGWRPNRPALLVHVARTLAELRGVPLAEVARTTRSNTARVFRLAAT